LVRREREGLRERRKGEEKLSEYHTKVRVRSCGEKLKTGSCGS